MATFDVLGPAGLTLTANLYVDRTETVAATAVALTESDVRDGWYRGTAALTGWHQATVLEATTPVAYWDLYLTADHVAIGYDRPDSMFPPGDAVTNITLPIPSAEQFTAHVVCRAADGTVQEGVTVHCVATGVVDDENTGNAWSVAQQDTISDADGLCVFLLPRDPGLRFKAWRTDGNARLFSVPVGGTSVAIPDLVG